jgi:hypothetical protein
VQISKEISIPVLKYRYLYRSTSPVSELVPVLVLAPRTGVLVLNLVPVPYRCHLELCERLSIFVKTDQRNMHILKTSKKKWPFSVGKKLEKNWNLAHDFGFSAPVRVPVPSTHEYRCEYSCDPVSTKFSTKFSIRYEESCNFPRVFENWPGNMHISKTPKKKNGHFL